MGVRWGAKNYSEWEANRRLWRRRQRLLKKICIGAVFFAAFGAAWRYLPQSMNLEATQTRWTQERLMQRPEVYYPNCATARAVGAAPINRGEPGYRPELDADSDGIACEPIPHWAR